MDKKSVQAALHHTSLPSSSPDENPWEEEGNNTRMRRKNKSKRWSIHDSGGAVAAAAAALITAGQGKPHTSVAVADADMAGHIASVQTNSQLHYCTD